MLSAMKGKKSAPKKYDVTNLAVLRISNHALESEALPTRIKILSWGDNVSQKGLIKVGVKTVAAVAKQIKDRFHDLIALDYEHNTVPGTEAFKRAKDPSKVAAYGTPEVVEGDGLYVTNLKYTPSGEEHAKEYHDLSPAVHLDKNGEVIFVHSAALVRQGAVPDLSFYNTETNTGDSEMDYKAILLTLLGLPEDATEEAVTAAVEQFTSAKKEVEASTVVASAETETTGDLTTLTAETAELKESVTALTASHEALLRENVVLSAAAQGKVIPLNAEEIAKTDVTTLKSMVEKITATVPLGQKTPEGTVITANAEPDETLVKVATACGLDPKEVANTKV